MKRTRLYVSFCLVVILGLFLVTSVSAQGGITPTPEQITIAGRRGGRETRMLLLQATGTITDLQIVPLDLHRADGESVLPAAAMHVELPAAEIAANGLLTVPVTVDLHGVPSGQFSGTLLARYHGGTLSVPVTVTVKDPWWPPLLVLLAGVGLGVGVSAYRAKGRPRDEVLVRVGQLREQLRGDDELAAPFRVRIEAHLVDVEAALNAEKWEAADQTIKKAEAVWSLWRKGREDWLAQLAYHAQLVQKLGDEPHVPHVLALRRKLEDALREAPGLEGPVKLREHLDQIAQQINDYLRLQDRLDQINQWRTRLPEDQAESWRMKAQALQQRLYELTPGDTEAYEALESDLDAALDKLAQEATQPRGVIKAASALEGRGLGINLRELLGPPPSAREITKESTTGAVRRLRRFTWASYAIAIALLAGAGFGELYVGNATFGAEAWGDYFALLAWGFGAEASRAAITEMVRGWNLPGIK